MTTLFIRIEHDRLSLVGRLTERTRDRDRERYTTLINIRSIACFRRFIFANDREREFRLRFSIMNIKKRRREQEMSGFDRRAVYVDGSCTRVLFAENRTRGMRRIGTQLKTTKAMREQQQQQQ